MTALLELRNANVSYGRTPILKDVNLSVNAGAVTVLLGANGAGKTTTLRAISNLMVQTRGEVWFAGERVEKKSTDLIARLGIAHVPDGRGTLTHLTVEENLKLGAYTRRDPAGVRADFDLMYQYFPVLKRRLNQQAGTLSGGEQQMLAIARALMSGPKLLLLDEPSFGLAPLIVKEIFGILAQIKEKERMSMLIVEQNAAIALRVADQAYLLETGEIVMEGPPAVFMDDAAVRRSYLGY